MTGKIPQTHRSAVLVQPGMVEVRELPVPHPGPGQVLLRIEKALAGGTDRKAFERGHPQIPMPGPFGHRYTGTVAALGPGAPPFEVGQAIMGVHSAPCKECSLCRKNREHLCPHVMAEKVLGAFGQYLCIPSRVARQNLYPRPNHLSADQAALLEPLACVVHALEMIDWRGVERVLVLGLGLMGLLFAQILPHYCQANLVGAGRRKSRLDLARKMGLDPVADLTEVPLEEHWPKREGFDLVIECTGKLDGWKTAFDWTLPGGQVMFFGGLPKDAVFPASSFRVHYEEVRILGSFHFSPLDVGRAREFLLQDDFQSEGLISGCYPLSQISRMMQMLSSGEGLQFAVDPWK